MDFLKPLVWDNVVKEAVRLLFLKIPLLSTGFFSPIVIWVVTKLTDTIYKVLKEFVDFKVIAFRNDNLLREWEISSTTLQIIANEYGIDSPQFKEERLAHQNHFAALIRFNK